MESQWYTYKDGKTEGPINWEKLQQQAKSGELQPENMVWKDPYKDWIAASEVNGLYPVTPAPSALLVPPPPLPIKFAENLPDSENIVPFPPAVNVLTTPETDKTPRQKYKLVLITILGFFLLLLAGVFYSIYSFYRDYNDDSLMDEIRAELAGESDVYSNTSVPSGLRTAPASETKENRTLTQLATNPLIAFLGMKEAEIKSRFGEPEDTGFWKGANYYSYSANHDILFFFADDLPGVVVGISYLGPEEILGIRVGMTMEEVRTILGEADYEGYDEDYTPPEYSYYYKFPGINTLENSERKELELIINTSSPHDPINYLDIFCK